MEIRGGEGEGAEGEGRGVRFPLNIFQGYFMDQEACDSELSFLKALVFVRLKKLIFSSSGIKDLFPGCNLVTNQWHEKPFESHVEAGFQFILQHRKTVSL